MLQRCSVLAVTLLFATPAWASAQVAGNSPSNNLLKETAPGSPADEVAVGRRLMQSRHPAAMKAAVALFRKAAADGDTEGEWELGYAYFSGTGVARDMHTGLMWMRKSLSEPHPPPDHMAKYGVMLGISGTFFSNDHRQEQEGAQWLQRSAESGSTLGMLMLGGDLLVGSPGIPKDPVAGEHWLLKASQLGNANAQYMLGVDYTFGGVLPPNIEAGVHWLRAAAKEGWIGAEGMLGYLLTSGDEHVPKNPSEGVQWAEKAATEHNPFGYYALGLAYQQGLGGKPVDPAKAWYNFAAAQHTDTNQQLAHIAHNMAVHLSEVGGELSSAQLETLQAEVSKIPLPKRNQQS